MPHTAGPWKIAEGSAGWILSENPYGKGPMHISDTRGWGHLTGKGGGCGFTEKKAAEIQDANACLISAAPELLAACELALNVVVVPDRESTDRCIEALKKAIAKAKGE